MSASYSADLRLAAEVIATLASVEGDLDEMLRDLRRRLGVLHEHWSGRAGQAHAEAQADWSLRHAEMQSSLGRMRAVVGTAAQSYEAAACTTAELWRALR